MHAFVTVSPNSPPDVAATPVHTRRPEPAKEVMDSYSANERTDSMYLTVYSLSTLLSLLLAYKLFGNKGLLNFNSTA